MEKHALQKLYSEKILSEETPEESHNNVKKDNKGQNHWV
jgi:hypothetical protein